VEILNYSESNPEPREDYGGQHLAAAARGASLANHISTPAELNSIHVLYIDWAELGNAGIYTVVVF
jgi:hypothetical protein